ncbi:MAG TPA: 16S rRNA (uracil(1498)-N(3))-methyltransferase [Caldimonas sp.]|nr:16S rRNA (uracil(1498)-N(3))-methyltransferase [Caldimonas sp.]
MARAARAAAPPRIHVGEALRRTEALRLPVEASRHLQVLRLQPGDGLTLFDGRGGEWSARVTAMGRDVATVAVDAHLQIERELATRVTIAVGMPANDRMDSLIEKATELGVAAIQPLVCARSVLRLEGERGRRRIAHWQAIAVAACEQSGRNRVPEVLDVQTLDDWLRTLPPRASDLRWLLAPTAIARFGWIGGPHDVLVLSGPEGGFTRDEQDAAQAEGFQAVSLGARVLRADTAPIAVLAACAVLDAAAASDQA